MSKQISFDWPSLSVGIAIVVAWFRLHLAVRSQRKVLEKNLERNEVEHLMLIQDYCRRHNLTLKDLPTRIEDVQ